MHASVRMSADRLSQLMAENEADMVAAISTGQKKWAQVLLRRRESLEKIENRLLGAMAASASFERTR